MQGKRGEAAVGPASCWSRGLVAAGSPWAGLAMRRS